MKFTKSSLPVWKKNEPLSKYSYIKLGGPADFFTVAKSADELAGAVEAAEKAGIRWFILGGGSNILVGDLGFKGLVIKNEARDIRVSRRLSRWRKFARSPSPARPDVRRDSGWPQTCLAGRQAAAVSLANLPTSIANSSRNSSNCYLIAESGALMSKLAAFAIGKGLAGLEMFMSVPGTLGGAIYNNSHFRPEKNEFIGNLVDSAEIMIFDESRRHFFGTLGLGSSLTASSPLGRSDSRGLLGSSSIVSKMPSSTRLKKSPSSLFSSKTVDREWFRFGYDYSRLQEEKAVVLRVKFRLRKEPPERLRERSLVLMKDRNSHQPIGKPSCGCMFKNPNRIEGSDPSRMSAGKLIDEAGMKGARVGGISVSQTHANFMVNDGTGKVGDVLELMARVKRRVKEKFGVELMPEIFMVGEFSHKPEKFNC